MTEIGGFEAHPRFLEREDGTFALQRTDFEAWVRIGETEVVLVQELPMLDATVTGETVAPVVEEGWFETFERRVEDVTTVVEAQIEAPEVDREGDVIHVETRIGKTHDAPEVAVSATTYIEGTWVEGIIPGYDYDEQVQSIRNRARQNAEEGP